MMFTISKEFAFEASHRLDRLDPDHKCGRWHGHSYRVVVEISGRTDGVTGFVIDYAELDPVKRWIDETLDHRSLNDVERFDGVNPTAEMLAYEIAVALVELVPALRVLRDAGEIRWRIGVSETAKTWAWCDLWAPWPPGDPLGLVAFELDTQGSRAVSAELAQAARTYTSLSRVQLQPDEADR